MRILRRIPKVEVQELKDTWDKAKHFEQVFWNFSKENSLGIHLIKYI